MEFVLRPIEPRDDAAVAAVIRAVMPEFGASGPGFAIHDPEVDAMCATYRLPRSAYFVVDAGGRVVGGAGVAPLACGDGDTCELRKMYLLREARGIGAGSELLRTCLDTAASLGFATCYLETLASMDTARLLYERAGFTRQDCARGATGHFGCDRFYTLDLRSPRASS